LAVLVKKMVLKPVVGFGVRTAETPLGRPDTESSTAPENPYCGLMETFVEVELFLPMLMVPLVLKVNVGTTTWIVCVADAVSAPDVPVRVTVPLPRAAELLALYVMYE
jgi:hypothetical protein